ncbi:Xaa-Pro aminopeptidase [Idiomarina sp. A28L]|uniref:Xaa-Pro aminopeptidase n=1 Tax=Idiomarina sp. A28L TaxID=1036674 RepID=UPI00021385A5|nr:Xaa-Pro aminopeptidase [Idiomarina sp. A28L]EGN75185.1 Xaa-Pro aminopeptidase [Idiomarina sp. A28L]
MIAVSELQARRAAFMKSMVAGSIAIFPASSEVIRSRDTHFSFRQDSDFFYLTGITEPDAVLVLAPDLETSEILFVLPKDAHEEVWHGRRLGTELAKVQSGVSACYDTSTLATQLPSLINGHSDLYVAFDQFPVFEQSLRSMLSELRNAPKRSKIAPDRLHDPRPQLHQQRLIKSPAEQAVMRHAAEISVAGHRRALGFVQPGVYEYQVAAELQHEFTMRGASGFAYESICGGGANACILHYTANTDVLADGDLILIDAGAEYAGYAGDITRTFPVNGKFTKPQREIYELVLASQAAAFEHLQPGSTIVKAQEACIEVLTAGLVKLGILSGTVREHIDKLSCRQFFIHGLSHWLGLDVHDVGLYQKGDKPVKLAAGMVLTVEPGLYFAPDDTRVPEQYRGIGVRIEDDLLINAQGHENLTAGVPKSIEGIEALMAQARRQQEHSHAAQR